MTTSTQETTRLTGDPAVCSTGSAETDLRKGLWLLATCSGLWYHNPNATGEINAIMVNGRLFGPQNKEVSDVAMTPNN